MSRTLHAITGAFGYSGRHMARRLLDAGLPVVSLTAHPDRPDPFEGKVVQRPLPFDDPEALRRQLEDVEVLYNTWWVRFPWKGLDHEVATRHSRALFDAAAAAGVRRVVHVSITHPSEDSPLSYFRGKARVERHLRESGLSHAILRPTVLFGGERDVLLNNIAWLLRRLPLFGVARGDYGLQPVHVEDLAALAVRWGASREDVVLDAVGPEVYGFRELVERLKASVQGRARILDVSPGAVLAASGVLGRVVGDVVLTDQELEGLRANLLISEQPATGPSLLSAWLRRHAHQVGRTWASELGRHYR